MSIRSPLAAAPRTGHQFATLGGGCFWCLEAVFEEVQGVVDVESGYTGGAVERPSYRQVCEGTTGHAEVVRAEFDPAQISYREVLEIFFTIHDPTTPSRQGNDIGTQYRSAIYVHSAEQRSVADDVIREAQAHYRNRIVTEVTDAGPYWRAEDYHQEYFRHNPEQGYCTMIVAPKVAKFRKTFAAKRRNSAGD
jgi:peptide-methionine (S)-S-oxide reductase